MHHDGGRTLAYRRNIECRIPWVKTWPARAAKSLEPKVMWQPWHILVFFVTILMRWLLGQFGQMSHVYNVLWCNHFWSAHSHLRRWTLVVPPAVIPNETAEGIWSGMKAKQPVLITGKAKELLIKLLAHCSWMVFNPQYGGTLGTNPSMIAHVNYLHQLLLCKVSGIYMNEFYISKQTIHLTVFATLTKGGSLKLACGWLCYFLNCFWNKEGCQWQKIWVLCLPFRLAPALRSTMSFPHWWRSRPLWWSGGFWRVSRVR